MWCLPNVEARTMTHMALGSDGAPDPFPIPAVRGWRGMPSVDGAPDPFPTPAVGGWRGMPYVGALSLAGSS